MSIAGIVLAAGRSRRMSTAKSLLLLESRTFLERVVEALRTGGCDPLIVVVGVGEEHERARAIAESGGCMVAVNSAPGSEQIDSLRLALGRLPPDLQGAMVTPVDVPLVSAALVDALIAVFRAGDGPLALPVHEGRHGHPVLFGSELFAELLHGDLPEGARSVVHAHAGEASVVEVEQLEMLQDVDTPDDLRRIRRR